MARVAGFVALSILMLAPSAGAITLADHGEARCSIVIADRAIAPERYAAAELRDTLKQVTGADFAVQTESQVSPDVPMILVGRTRLAAKLLVGVDWESLGYDGIVIRTVGDKLILSGGQPRGAIYAVYSFLEDTVGCRWWTSSESYIPRVSVLEVPALDTVYVPKLRYREAFYTDPLGAPKFAVKMKLNGNFYRIPNSYGGNYEILGWCHTAYQLLPPKDYFAKHPEWYSLIDGKRMDKWSQLCWTNDEMRAELTKKALEWIKKNPKAGIISISQNDCLNACQCDKCKAVEAEEGAQSGPLIRFVNAVAEDIEKQYPDFLVETLAYTYSRKPPVHVKPRKNVVIRLCSFECNFIAPMESEYNAAFRDDVKRWSALAPHLYIWNYVTNFASHIMPHPNMRGLGPDLRFFVKNNAIGVFEQGDSATTVGDFVRLRNWVISHLMWNPDLDQEELTSEFLKGYYGAAAPYLARYIELEHDAVAKTGMYLNLNNNGFGFLTLDDMIEANRLWDKAAEAVKSDPVLSVRVKRDKLPLDHMWLVRYNELKAASDRRGIPFPGPKDGKAAVKEFIKAVRDWKNMWNGEGKTFEAYIPTLKTHFAPPLPESEEFAKFPKDDVVEIQQDKMELQKLGEWTFLVDDPLASDGKAAMMPGSHGNMAVRFNVTEEFAKAHPGAWHCYALVRAEGAKDGMGCRFAMYDGVGHKDVAVSSVNMPRIGNGPYRTLYLGSLPMKQGYFFWLAPWSNPDVVKGVYVDRIVLVSDKDEW